MIDSIRNLLPEDDVRVCSQMEMARGAPWAVAPITQDIIRRSLSGSTEEGK